MTASNAPLALPLGWCIAPPVVLGAAAAWLRVGDLDRPLFAQLNAAGSVFDATVWASITDTASILGAGAILALLLLRAPRAVVAAILAWPAAIVLIRGLKWLIDAPRPADLLAEGSFTQIGAQLSGYSFPSGHTATAFAVAGALIFSYPYARRGLVAAAILALAALVGASRIAVGAHWPGDVAAGAALGWVSAIVGAALALRWPVLWSARSWRMALAVVGMVVALARALVETGYPEAALWAAALGLCAAGVASRAFVRAVNSA